MLATDELMTRFYQHLGELFFAIAKSDGVVRPEEELMLKKIIDTEWAPLEESEDEFHSDAAYQMESVFQNLNEGFTDAETAYEDFRLFHLSHQHLFTEEVITLTLTTANEIASVFHGKNKSELFLLLKLELLLKGN